MAGRHVTDDIRLVECRACDGSGHELHWFPQPDDPYYMRETCLTCPDCDGQGRFEVEVEPIEEFELFEARP